jgi:hypothetical protein
MEYFQDGVHTNDDGTKEYDMNYFRKKTSLDMYLETLIKKLKH